jgi:hypothetical protein
MEKPLTTPYTSLVIDATINAAPTTDSVVMIPRMFWVFISIVKGGIWILVLKDSCI